MARSKVTFDSNAFKRNLQKVANDAATTVAGKLSVMLNGMSKEFEGRPVEEIKPVLQQRWASTAGGSITDPELTQYAEQIAAGGTFNITAKS
ncbi:hypothetical protein OH809_45165 (plasmid) [Streptomyces sp. NBC_00873]|uniref:hypothetical protein n=1 Tax=Streptomyces sp. NBC_00873 TaxID=2975852 RepID=UPI0037DC9CE5|nr:hypothetical protein OH809_45165 [Streptomyces sp. NBC_00873]